MHLLCKTFVASWQINLIHLFIDSANSKDGFLEFRGLGLHSFKVKTHLLHIFQRHWYRLCKHLEVNTMDWILHN